MSIEKITANYTDASNQMVVMELGKVVIAHTAGWATVLFRAQELDKKTGEYKAPIFILRRYKKSGEEYRTYKSIRLTNNEQATALINGINELLGA